MTLNFGLLPGTEIDLKERWQQQGSTLINTQNTISSGSTTIRTVTAKKKTYITSVIISYEKDGDANDIVDGDKWSILDNATTKIAMIGATALQGTTQTLVFNTPMSFSTSIVVSETAGQFGFSITFLGWEE